MSTHVISGVLSTNFGQPQLRQKQVVNDEVGGVPIVLIASPNSDSVRVYERKNYRFSGGQKQVVELGMNAVWTIQEDSLSNPNTGDSLPRISNVFVSFWFAWFQFYPDTLFYDPATDVDEGPVSVDAAARLRKTWGEIKR